MALAMALISGASSAGVLAFINFSLQGGNGDLPGMAWVFAGLCLLMHGSGVLSSILWSMLGQGVIENIRMELSNRVLQTPQEQIQCLGIPKLMATLSQDVNAFGAISLMLPVAFINGTILVGAIGYLAWLSWELLLGVAAVIALGVLLFVALQGRAMRRFAQARNECDRLYEHFRALTEGGKELKMHARWSRDFVGHHVRETVSDIKTATNQGTILYAFATHGNNLLLYGMIGLVIFIPSLLPDISGSTARSFVVAILFITPVLSNLVIAWQQVGHALVSARKLQSLALAPAGPSGGPPPDPAPGGCRGLELKNIQHRYRREADDSPFELGPVDLGFVPGELVFVTGGNGSGKTTLAYIILGLYTPLQGEIWLNGIPIADDNREWYRQHFSVVFSDPFLFEQLLGGADIDRLDERARDLLRKFQLDKKVQVRDGRFTTLNLSHGQRKRLALILACLDDKPFYLLDEWASDQDPVFKRVFYTEILPELRARHKTVIVITHDDQYFHLADRCVKLADGQIVPQAAPAPHDTATAA